MGLETLFWLIDYTEIRISFLLNTNLYPGYTVIQFNSQSLTTVEGGATFFAANYKGGPLQLELSQQWNIHYI